MAVEVPIPLIQGTHDTAHVFYKHVRAVRKRLNKQPKTLVNALKAHIITTIPGCEYRKLDAETNARQEAAILRQWSGAGIPVPQVTYASTKELITEYIPGINYAEALTNAYRPNVFAKLLETLDKITAYAKKRHDPKLLHLDPHLHNFIYANDTAYAIDPETRYNTQYNLQDIIAQSQLFFLRQLSPLSHNKQYMSDFLDSLSHKEKDLMRAYHRPTPLKAKLASYAVDVKNVLRNQHAIWKSSTNNATYSLMSELLQP